jgi:hypothetical protein
MNPAEAWQVLADLAESRKTVRLPMAAALVRFLKAQYVSATA